MLFLSAIVFLSAIPVTVLWKQRSRLPTATKVAIFISVASLLLWIVDGTMTVPNQVFSSLSVLSYWVLVYLVWRDKNVKQD